MIPYPDIKPYIFRIGPIQVRWYGLMYIFGFAASYLLVRKEVARRRMAVGKPVIDELYFYLILGLILGARLGYVLFYNLPEYLRNPIEILAVWRGGMSFHGGLIGALLGGIYISGKRGLDFWTISDMVMATVPIGLGLGRIGNFINGELYGRITEVPWAMVFPGGGRLPRHPSQLYEAVLEGLVLFVILWTARNRTKRKGDLTALFLVLYGLMRSFAELFREPDPQIGLLAGRATMGQLLSSLMILAGAIVFISRRAGKERNGARSR